LNPVETDLAVKAAIFLPIGLHLHMKKEVNLAAEKL
jgi:hypothetical protein